MKFQKRQQGAVALVIALVLVFGMAVMAFFANRGMIFEQKTSANQYRATRAFEVAEAGIEWALAQLNDDRYLANAPSCAPGSGTPKRSFRERYLQPSTTLPVTFSPLTTTRAGCSIAADGSLTCSCPTGTNAPTLGSSTDPRFTVLFSSGGDATTVEIISYGCTNAGAACDPVSTDTPDASAVVRVLAKVRPKFPNAPGAGVVAGAAATTGGSLNVINLDVESNGITINSGTPVVLGAGTSVVTLPGTPPRASILDNDPSLSALTNADVNGDLYFQSFFGETQAQYQANPQTWVITGDGQCGSRAPRCRTCGNSGACGDAAVALLNEGVTQFWIERDVQFNNGRLPTVGTIGEAQRPIIMAGTGEVEFNGNIVAYGMFYVGGANALATWEYNGSGNAQIFGTFIARGNFKRGNGNLDLIYSPSVYRNGEGTGVLVRVPGSWRDARDAFL
jgi:hypothetical protein